jgi:site-specific DNA-methyltransferase (adenine-specific)
MDWRTPACVLERVRRVDDIALDPCTTPDDPCGAAAVLSLECGHDGLVLGWTGYGGLVYANPPYGHALPRWVAKALLEVRQGAEIILLVPSRTDTRWWGWAYDACQAVAFWKGRLTFEGAPAPAPFPSCLFYFGERQGRFKRAFSDAARVIPGGGA